MGRTRCIPVEERGKRFNSEGSTVGSLEVLNVAVENDLR